MKKAIIFTCVMLVASFALAADIAKNPNIHSEGTYRAGYDIIHSDRAQTAVVSMYEGVFEDVSGYYLAGMAAAGHIADYHADPMGAVDYSGYELVLVSTADNWFGTDFGTEIPVLAAYMDAGGKVVIIGQDWLWGSGDYGFASSYLGMAGASEDVNGNDYGSLTWNGTAGGPLVAQGGSFVPCFTSNGWYTDAITPSNQGLVSWSSPFAPGPQEGGSIGSNGMLSTVEFACGSVDVVGHLTAWWLTTAHEESNISDLKSRY